MQCRLAASKEGQTGAARLFRNLGSLHQRWGLESQTADGQHGAQFMFMVEDTDGFE